jgi:D-glycero-alpha-D-manno-heptose-7-phosphate kinase
MVQLAYSLKLELESGSLDSFGAILHENWRLKAQLATGISDSQIDSWYETGLRHGALGGKLLGAGNGGFLMFVAPPDRHRDIIEALSGLSAVRFRFERAGVQTVFFNPPE